MIVTRANFRSLNWPALLTLVLPVGCLLWAFGNTLSEMFHAWQSPQFSHGYLVGPFALFLLWHRRGVLATGELRPSWLGLPLLAAGIGLHLYGAYYYYIWIDAVAFLPTLAGLWLTCGGKTGWRWGWPSILFLFFMIPLPYRAAIALSGPLQRLATVLSTFIMQCLGMPALSEGNIITLNEHAIDVVEACSGLRMLVVFFALSTAVVLLFQRHWLDKLILILSAVPIALVSNITRILVTGILYDLFNDSATITHWVHESADWLMMPLGLGLLWIELQLLNHLFIELPPTPPRVSRTTPPRRTAPAPLVRQRQTAAAGKREAARLSTQRRERQAPPAALQEAQPAPTTTTVQPSVGTEEVKR